MRTRETIGVERDVGHLNSWPGRLEKNVNDRAHVLPPARGELTSHNPVAEDEVTRIPKRTRTYSLASVRTHTLD